MLMQANHSIRTIARQLGRAPSTISRELARHTIRPDMAYDASFAGYRARLTRCTLKRTFPDNPDHRVSHSAVYNTRYVIPRGSLKK